MKPEISVIIVNYKVKELLFGCLHSIYASKPAESFEVIVVDNDEIKTIENELKKRFPKVLYVKSNRNVGFSAGNNLGAKYAKGNYLFFLNPDTKILKGTIDALYAFIKKNNRVGLVSPLILGKDSKPLDRQGYKELNFVNGLFTFSFLRKRFKNFSVASYYSLADWEKEPVKKVDTVYGAALMVKRNVFERLHGFDEDYFLYFEENDLSKRVRNLGLELYINSNSRIIHEVGQSTKDFDKRDDYFSKSRFIYYKKHFGVIQATLLELLIKINKTSLSLLLILLSAIFLRIYNLSISMPFIGDQGWFYLSARDLLIHGNIPLVGITSSHTWLHQGPLWTYMLSVALLLFKFNPVGGAYVTALFGILTTFFLFKFCSELFSKRIGLIAAGLYAVSPLTVLFDRMPFDPGPIPFFTLVYFFCVYKWLNGNKDYFPRILFLIAVLYNLELATFTLFFPFALLFAYGVYKKEQFIRNIKNTRIIIYSFIALIVPMLPVIVYDFSHGFKQTIVFLGWTLYKPFSFLFKSGHNSLFLSGNTMFSFFYINIQKLIFDASGMVSLIIFIFSLIFILYKVIKQKNIIIDRFFLLLFFLSVSLAGIAVNQTPSDAYLPITFPFIAITVAILFDYFLSIKKLLPITYTLLFFIICSNFYFSYKNTFIPELGKRVTAANEIIALTNGQEYNLIGKGPGSQFSSFTMDYEYLLWWMGHPVSEKNAGIKIIVTETDNKISVIKKL